MKLLTLNVHAWLEENQEEKIEALAQVIAEKRYDLIALQEVNQLMTAPFVTRTLKADNYGLVLLEKLKTLGIGDYSFYWSPSHIGYDRYDEGIAFLTKLPVYDVDAFYCSRKKEITSVLSRKIMGLTVSYQGQLIDCYSCHINLPQAEGEDQLENVQTILDRQPEERLKLLMGDFNVDALSDKATYQGTYQGILDLGLKDTYQLAVKKDNGVTVGQAIDGWQHEKSSKRLDYIFLNQEKKVRSSQVIFNGLETPLVSDHFGVEVELDLA